ncbi:OmpG porin family protein [Orbaceae bacterium ESL0721]|nr:OmpG porin family protein [Orbaceae bacterium ESL0721]
MKTDKQRKPLRNSIISLCIGIIPLSCAAFADNNHKYAGGYQSYFKKQSDIKKEVVTYQEPKTDQESIIDKEKTADVESIRAKQSITSPPIAADSWQSNASLIATHESSTQLQKQVQNQPQLLKQNSVKQPIKDRSEDATKLTRQKHMEADDLLFITNPNEVPAAWFAIDDNLSAGGFHGNLRAQIESDNIRWKHHHNRNGGSYKLAPLNAFLRHDELPNWYFGFYFAKEESYKGGIWDQSFQDNTNISEAFVGHIFETYRGNIGLEGMFGGESGLNRLKSRAKGWVDLRLTHNTKLGGYAFYEYQPNNNRPDNVDGHAVNIETEPNLTYIFDNNNGIWLSTLYKHNLQTREKFGNILEVEQNVRVGFYHNWRKLFSSYYVGLGRLKKYNEQHSSELFYKSNFKMIGLTASYPIVSSVRAYGEFKYEHTKEYGLWSESGRNWNPFTTLGVVYEF